MTLTMTYNDHWHTYYLEGDEDKPQKSRAASVTALAKIPTDQSGLEKWKLRQVAVGMAMDRNLVENVAVDLDNKKAIQKAAANAIDVADRRRAADRGTQMHKVLELVLSERRHLILTAQQERDAAVLRRTLDRYGLTPEKDYFEQFVLYPGYRVTGRFDCILRRPNDDIILTDLKSGTRAIEYPQSVAVQLALYANAPMISANVEGVGDQCIVNEWRAMPTGLDRKWGYVMLVEPDAEVGTLHRIDIEHGWRAAQLALEVIKWRREKIVVDEVPPWRTGLDDVATFAARAIANARTVDEVRELWKSYGESGELTAGMQQLLTAKAAELKGVA